MSDNYRDGCPGKRWRLSWFIVQMVYLAAWFAGLGERKSRR